MATKNVHEVAKMIAAAREGKTIQDFINLLPENVQEIVFQPDGWFYQHRTDLLPPLSVDCAPLWDVVKKYIPIANKEEGHSIQLQVIGRQYGFYELTDVWARGSYDGDGVVQAWCTSLGHYTTLMSPFITQVAVAQQARTWSAIFAQRCPAI